MRSPSATAARIAAVAILAAVSVAACGISSTGTPSTGAQAGPSGTPIQIGISLSKTGDFSADGLACLRGYQLWANDVNSHGGLLGRPVKLVVLNDNSDPGTAAKNYTTLITQDHVNLVLGPFSSLLTIPAAQTARKYGYALIEGSGTAPAVYNTKLPNLFGVSAPVVTQMQPFARWVASLPASQRPRTAAYAMVDDPFADPPVEAAQRSFRRRASQPSTTIPAWRDRPVSPTSCPPTRPRPRPRSRPTRRRWRRRARSSSSSARWTCPRWRRSSTSSSS